jgi:hypothetical protein
MNAQVKVLEKNINNQGVSIIVAPQKLQINFIFLLYIQA